MAVMKQYVLTPAAGKRLIGKAMVVHPAVQHALISGTIVIVAGTTNGYVAEELLACLGHAISFDRRRFVRGVTLPPSSSVRRPEGPFCGDLVITDGNPQIGTTIFDVLDSLKAGDVILKGANALDFERRRAAVLIGDPRGGTAAAAVQAAVGRRVRLVVPVGVEKRVTGSLDALAARLNAPGAEGPRLLPVPGEVVTEIEAIKLLSGASAELVAGGGVGGAEGCVWLAVDGTDEQMLAMDTILSVAAAEPPFTF
jgi:hypothetical protein